MPRAGISLEGQDDPNRPKLVAVMRPRRRVRAELVQLSYLFGGVALGVIATQVHVGPPLSSADIRALLFAVGGGVIALVSVIFSLLFLVVQWGSSTFTPRLRACGNRRSVGFT
jgi:hypothetical protein